MKLKNDSSKTSKLIILFCRPGQQPVPMEISPSIGAMEKLVGGYIEQEQRFKDGVIVIYKRCDVEPKIPFNFKTTPFLLCRYENFKYESLTGEQIEKYMVTFSATRPYPRKDIIQFVDHECTPKFCVPSGSEIELVCEDGHKLHVKCDYADDYHFFALGQKYHIGEFAEIMKINRVKAWYPVPIPFE